MPTIEATENQNSKASINATFINYQANIFYFHLASLHTYKNVVL